MGNAQETKEKPDKPDNPGGPGKPLVTITVNNKAVPIEGPRRNGAEIKAAAIAAGVRIQADFQLAEEVRNGEREIIGDDQTVTVNKNSIFWATAPDDNS